MEDAENLSLQASEETPQQVTAAAPAPLNTQTCRGRSLVPEVVKVSGLGMWEKKPPLPRPDRRRRTRAVSDQEPRAATGREAREERPAPALNYGKKKAKECSGSGMQAYPHTQPGRCEHILRPVETAGGAQS